MGKKFIITVWIIIFIILLGFIFWPPIAQTTVKNDSWKYDLSDNSVAAISDNGKFIVVGDESNTVYFFNTSNSQPKWSYNAIHDIVSVGISSNGEYLVAGSRDHKIYFFKNSSSTPLWNYDTGATIDSVAISNDGKYIVAGSNDTIYYFDNSIATPKLPIWSNSTGWSEDYSYVSNVLISSDGSYILTVHPWSFRLFSNLSSYPIREISFHGGGMNEPGDEINSVAMSSDGNYFVVGRNNQRIYLFNKSSSTPEWTYNAFDIVTRVGISADGNYLSAVSADGILYFFQKTNSTPLWYYSSENGYSESLALSSNGNYLASVFHDTVYLFQRTSNTPILELDNYYGGHIDISADGKLLILSGSKYLYLCNTSNPIIVEPPSSSSVFNQVGTWLIPFLTSSGTIITIISIIVSRKKKKKPTIIRAPVTETLYGIGPEKELIFISYATVDSGLFQIPRITKILASYPEIDEVLYWESDMHDDIYQYMDENLQKCKVVILFCSKSSLYSEAVKMEWRSALKLDKKLIPVFINQSDIPPLLTTKLGVQFNESDPYSSIEEMYKMILKKIEIESFREFTKHIMPKRITEKEFEQMNVETIEKAINFDGDMPSHELELELVSILRDCNFYIPGKEMKKIKKKPKKAKKSTLESSEDEFRKFKCFAELKDDKEDIALSITIQNLTDQSSKVFIRATGKREWILNEILNNINLKCIELKSTNEIIRQYSEKVGALLDQIGDFEKFLRKYLGSNVKKLDKIIVQYKNKEIEKEEFVIKCTQIAGKDFIITFIKNIPSIYKRRKMKDFKKSG